MKRSVGAWPPKKERAPFEKRADEMRKEMVRICKIRDERIVKIRQESQVLIDAATAAKTRAEFALAEVLSARVDVAKLNHVNQRGFFGRVWFRLWYLLTGRIA